MEVQLYRQKLKRELHGHPFGHVNHMEAIYGALFYFTFKYLAL